ncbi:MULTISPECIES: hypothetical protein [Selenomonas]|uniref:Uncharacterized protein n=1 Tax=Selenomonas ruminis TaxID=2593411 RepID=A0A5D6W633_9FIRM|nr:MULTISPECIES: hypothetical protein [unclassified Selenomonas]MBQ1867814.1 hypothetical protein [Selenomonas sp.]TYZ23911.1 hypothetical protein FZ040_04080 [Selenomonas sp. mPRGC5]
MMNLIDWFNEKKKLADDIVDRGKFWILCTRKHSYIFCFTITYLVLFWNYWPFFLRQGILGLQPFKLFGIFFGGVGGEWLYRCGQYFLLDNPRKISENELKKEGVYVILGIIIIGMLLIMIQILVWNCWHVDLSWLTGVGPAMRRL